MSGAMEKALLMRVSVFTDQGGRKYMEDVTEVTVEPEPGEDEPTWDEQEDSDGVNLSSSPSDLSLQLTEPPPDESGPSENQNTRTKASCLPADANPPAVQPGRSRGSVAFFAVFDGHGGREAAQFARDFLWEFIKKQRGFWSGCDREVCSAIRKGFIACHHAMWKKLRKLNQHNTALMKLLC